MSWLAGIVLVVVALAVAAEAYVLFAPSDPADWHVDPAEAPEPGQAGERRTGEAAPRFDAAPEAVLSALAAVAAARPRTEVLAGSPEAGRITWVTRTQVMRFPDYVTVAARPEGDGTRLDVLSRSRFGRGDFGVNAARLDDWLAGLRQRLDG